MTHSVRRVLVSLCPFLALGYAVACGTDVEGIFGGTGGSEMDASAEAEASTTGMATEDASTAVEADAASIVTVTIEVGSVGKGPAAYGNNPLTIPVGTTVTWINQDALPHTATSDTGVFDSGTLLPTQSFSYTFQQAGTYPYYCTIHGQASMSGTIVVQ